MRMQRSMAASMEKPMALSAQMTRRHTGYIRRSIEGRAMTASVSEI